MITSQFLLTDDYFLSGFNGSLWALSNQPELDQYYFHFKKPILNHLPLHEEIVNTLVDLRRKFKNLTLIDDQSLETKIIKKIAPDISCIPIPLDLCPTEDFIHMCSAKYGLDDPEMIWALFLAKELKEPLVFSKWEIRILNANFLRSTNSTYGNPYFVYVENEKFHRLRVAQKELNLPFCWNLLKSSPTLFRSYFFHPLMQQWFRNDSMLEPHNYEVERKILLSLLSSSESTVTTTQDYKWALGSWASDLQRTLPLQQAAFPIHLLFEKVFQQPTELNSAEKTLYGI